MAPLEQHEPHSEQGLLLSSNCSISAVAQSYPIAISHSPQKDAIGTH